MHTAYFCLFTTIFVDSLTKPILAKFCNVCKVLQCLQSVLKLISSSPKVFRNDSKKNSKYIQSKQKISIFINLNVSKCREQNIIWC